MRVRDLMTKNVACCRANEPLSVAAQLMWDCDCGAVPVLDDSGSRAVGVITDRDICMATWIQNRPPAAIPVSEAMSRSLHCCSPEDDLVSAETIMKSKQIRRLPVVDGDNRVLGILSLADIALESSREAGRRQREVLADEVATTLANICQGPSNTTIPATA